MFMTSPLPTLGKIILSYLKFTHPQIYKKMVETKKTFGNVKVLGKGRSTRPSESSESSDSQVGDKRGKPVDSQPIFTSVHTALLRSDIVILGVLRKCPT